MSEDRKDRISDILGTAELPDKTPSSDTPPELMVKNMIHPYLADALRKNFTRPIFPQALSVDECVTVAVENARWNGIEEIIKFIESVGDL